MNPLAVDVSVEEDPLVVARREYVADPEVEVPELAGEAGPVPREGNVRVDLAVDSQSGG